MTGAHRLAALVLLAGVMLIDGYDLNAMALAIPHLAPEMGLAPTDFGIVQSADLLGLGIGAFLIAPFGDRYGRKLVIVTGCLVIAAATLATGLASSLTGFAVWRLLTGIALGACLANVSALSAELAPDDKRSTVMAIVSAGIAIGAVVAGVTSPEVVGFGGWRALFYVPAGIAFVLAVLLAVVLKGGAPEKEPVLAGSAPARIPFSELVRPPLLFPLLVFALTYMTNAVALYMLVRWTPVLLPQAGFEVDLAARIQGLLQGSGLVVGIGLAFLIDKWRPGPTLTLGYAAIIICLVAVWASPPTALVWGALLIIAGGGITGVHAALMSLTAKLFPSHVLSSAIGTAVAISRVGAIAAPIFGAALIEGGISPAGYFLVLAIPAGLCCALSLLIPGVILKRPEIRA